MTDQIFNPGDKVMRVCRAGEVPNINNYIPGIIPETDFGKVLCVKECFLKKWNKYHSVFFVGLPYKFFSPCFRKVDEIKLCVNAANKIKDLRDKEWIEEIINHNEYFI